jgi:hypothetical protein
LTDEDGGDPFAEGREAFDAGWPETTNPYDPDEGFDDFTKWNDGWLTAQREAKA